MRRHWGAPMSARLTQADFPPEMAFLIACLGPAPGLPPWPRTGAPGLLLALASAHGVSHLLWQRLQQAQTPPSNGQAGGCAELSELLAPLAQLHARNAMRHLAAQRDLIGLTDRFAAAGIRVMPLKGVLLAGRVHAQATLRDVGDIDLLIDVRDLARAHTLLLAAGLRDRLGFGSLGAGAKRWYLRFHKDVEYTGAAPLPRHVELHWRLQKNAWLLRTDFDALWSRGRAVELAGRSLRTLGDEDTLLHLCAHGGNTAWYRLKWLADLPGLLATPGLDWPRLVARAEDRGCLRALGLALVLARELFGIETPAPAACACAGVRAADLYFVRDALLSPGQWWHWSGPSQRPCGFIARQLRFGLMLGDGWRYRVDYLLDRAIVLDDVRLLNLPLVLFPLYVLLRPFTWAWRQLWRKPA